MTRRELDEQRIWLREAMSCDMPEAQRQLLRDKRVALLVELKAQRAEDREAA